MPGSFQQWCRAHLSAASLAGRKGAGLTSGVVPGSPFGLIPGRPEGCRAPPSSGAGLSFRPRPWPAGRVPGSAERVSAADGAPKGGLTRAYSRQVAARTVRPAGLAALSVAQACWTRTQILEGRHMTEPRPYPAPARRLRLNGSNASAPAATDRGVAAPPRRPPRSDGRVTAEAQPKAPRAARA